MRNNEKELSKIKKTFSFIFNKDLVALLNKHFDKNASFILLTIALLQNKIGSKIIYNNFYINREEWTDLFISLYQNNLIINAFDKIKINPVISIDNIINSFNCFDQFIDQLIHFLEKHQLNLGIEKKQLKQLFKNIFIYLSYNKINVQLAENLNDIIIDNDYDKKFLILSNNTKLFSVTKKMILDNFGDKINDLIVFLLIVNITIK